MAFLRCIESSALLLPEPMEAVARQLVPIDREPTHNVANWSILAGTRQHLWEYVFRIPTTANRIP